MTRLLVRLRGLSRTFAHTAASASFTNDVERVIVSLERLNAGTEEEFLAVGGKLMEFRSSAREISSRTSALTGLINGEHGARVASALNAILEYSRDANARLTESSKALEGVRAQAAHIRAAFTGLRRLVSIFRTVCTLVRIETSRLASGADFGGLVAEVQPLSENIQTSGEGVLETCSLLERNVLDTLSRKDELRAQQLRGMAQVIAEAGEGLRAFDERRQRAAEAAIEQAAQFGEVSDALDGVVRAIQFHDITRQQVEHVIAALRQAKAGPDGERGALLRLQAAQLARAAAIFQSSTANLAAALDRITARVQAIAQSGCDLNGTSAGEQDSFFLHMEKSFTGILKMLRACGSVQGEAEGMVGPLQETIAQMLERVAEIRGLEIRIQRIALNAAVRAAHIGAPGDALVVVAGVMQNVAAESSANTDEVSGTLHSMSSEVNLHWGAASQDSAAPDGVTEEMQRSVLSLHTASEMNFVRVQDIAMLGARLAAEIGAVRESFSAGARFASVAAEALGELERLAAHYGGVGASPPEGLDDLSVRYTMQVEREVHECAVRGGEAAPGQVADDSLGDNIELF